MMDRYRVTFKHAQAGLFAEFTGIEAHNPLQAAILADSDQWEVYRSVKQR